MLLSASAGEQSLEAASVKPSQPVDPGRRIAGFQTSGGGRLNALSASLRMMIMFAYNGKDFQNQEGPAGPNPIRTISWRRRKEMPLGSNSG